MDSLYTRRVETPKSDTIAAYIGFLGGELKLFECNTQNQTIRIFTLDEQDPAIPADKLEKARESRGMAFYQVKVYSHPHYTEYYNLGAHGTKYKKQDFWVRTTAPLCNMKNTQAA